MCLESHLSPRPIQSTQGVWLRGPDVTTGFSNLGCSLLPYRNGRDLSRRSLHSVRTSAMIEPEDMISGLLNRKCFTLQHKASVYLAAASTPLDATGLSAVEHFQSNSVSSGIMAGLTGRSGCLSHERLPRPKCL